MARWSRQPAGSRTIATAGTLGQVVPPSIVLILLADVVGVPFDEQTVRAWPPDERLITLLPPTG